MTAQIPSTMLALAIHQFCGPKDYDVATLPTPSISQPDDVLIKVHSASINPGELKLANGLAKLVKKDVKFPIILGYDVAGTVLVTGTAVTHLHPGDEIYSQVPEHHKGTAAEYVLSRESRTFAKPRSLDFSAAASIPLAATTALKSLSLADAQLASRGGGGLKGKTVLIPGGLSGTGLFAVQLAKNVFGAATVITTLSTGKISLFREVLGADYQIVDYTTEKLVDVVPRASVDFMFDTMGEALAAVPLMKKGGVVVSISTAVPSGTALREAGLEPSVWMVYVLNFCDWVVRRWMGWKGVRYSCYYPNSDSRDLDRLAGWVDEGKVVPIVGSRAKLSDIEAVRKGCQQVFDGKGGVGKFVIDVL